MQSYDLAIVVLMVCEHLFVAFVFADLAGSLNWKFSGDLVESLFKSGKMLAGGLALLGWDLVAIGIEKLHKKRTNARFGVFTAVTDKV